MKCVNMQGEERNRHAFSICPPKRNSFWLAVKDLAICLGNILINRYNLIIIQYLNGIQR